MIKTGTFTFEYDQKGSRALKNEDQVHQCSQCYYSMIFLKKTFSIASFQIVID